MVLILVNSGFGNKKLDNIRISDNQKNAYCTTKVWANVLKKTARCVSHLPPVIVGLLQQDESLSLPDADLPSVRPAVVVVILGLQNHGAAGDPAHRHPPRRRRRG